MYLPSVVRWTTYFVYLLLTLGKANTQLLRSGELGVLKCVLQGQWDDMPVQLYTFLSACSPSPDDSKIHVTGIFFLDNLGPIDTLQLPQMKETREWTKTKKALVLRSPHTGRQWPLSLMLVETWGMPCRRRIPGRLSAVLSLGPLDARHMEFHLVAKPGFHTFCSFLPGAIHPVPWPGQPAPQTPLAGIKHCAWRADGPEPGSDVSSASPPLTYLILSPFFGLPPSDYVTLLEHHMRYHQRLGVDRYLVYVEGGFTTLSANPRVQALVGSGKLRVVSWEEVPHYFMNKTSQNRHPYASQLLVYNHALVALWHEDAVVAVADIDEYLMTPEKTTLSKLLYEYRDENQTQAVSILIPRRVGYCTSCCDVVRAGSGRLDVLDKALLQEAHPLERALWLNAPDAGGIMAAASELPGWEESRAPPSHPLALYGMSTPDYEPKSVLAVRHVAFMNPHRAYPMPPMRNLTVPKTYAFWLHLRSQLVLRLPKGFFMFPGKVARNYQWAIDELDALAAPGG